jgi:hypothetical protein
MPSVDGEPFLERSRLAYGWLVLWAAFVAYAAVLAPPDDPALTQALVRGSVSGHYGAVDPSIASVFSMLGVVPVLASAFVLRDGATRRLPAWPFALGMFVVGAFALLPWLALRNLGGPRGPRAPGPVRRLLARRVVGAGIVAALVALGGWCLARGHATDYLAAFRSTSLVHVMTIDLVVCTGLLFVLVEEARRRLPRAEPAVARAVRIVPLLGPALWNVLVARAP